MVHGTAIPFSVEEIESAKLLADRLAYIHDQFSLQSEASHLKAVQSAQEKLLHDYEIAKEVLRERDLLLESVGEGVYGVDLDGVCFFVNPKACTLLGYTKEEIIGKNTHSLFHHHHLDGSRFPISECILHGALAQNKQLEHQDWLIRKNGEMFPVHIIATPFYRNGILQGGVIAFNDITLQYTAEQKLIELNTQLQQEAITDPLTQLYNRRYFQEYGNLQFNRCKNENIPLSIIAMDLDYFKNINDTYGHDCGDKVLIALAQIAKSKLRDKDVFARVGGEEFTIILPESPLERSLEIAERIREHVAKEPIVLTHNEMRCTLSLGISVVNDSDKTFFEFVRRADEMLYKAKRNGRNRVEYI